MSAASRTTTDGTILTQSGGGRCKKACSIEDNFVLHSPSSFWAQKRRTNASVATQAKALPASGLEHVRFFKAAYRQAFHRALEVFAHLK
jgi:hypothetical protein